MRRNSPQEEATPMHTMRRTLRLWIVLLALLLGPAQALASPFNQSATYTVEEGDTWMSIAFRFGVPVEDVWVGNGVANPDLLAPGQRLFIPGASLREDTAGSIIELAPGTGFLEVAANSDTMLVTLQTINHAQWPYLAENQAIYIPDAILHLPPPPAYIVDSSSISAQDLQATLAPPVASVPQVVEPLAPHIGRDSSLPPLRQSRLGVQGNFLGPNQKPLLDRIGQNLGVGWVKQQVLWKVIEPDKGVYQEEGTGCQYLARRRRRAGLGTPIIGQPRPPNRLQRPGRFHGLPGWPLPGQRSGL
jgi:LysM repeat protein